MHEQLHSQDVIGRVHEVFQLLRQKNSRWGIIGMKFNPQSNQSTLYSADSYRGAEILPTLLGDEYSGLYSTRTRRRSHSGMSVPTAKSAPQDGRG